MKLRTIFEVKYYLDKGQIELTQSPKSPGPELEKFRQYVTNAIRAGGVLYREKDIFDIVYGVYGAPSISSFLEAKLHEYNDDPEIESFESQESYLGYIPSNDMFAIGFDTRTEAQDENFISPNIILFTIEDEDVGKWKIWNKSRGMLYAGRGYERLHVEFPTIIDVRG